MKSGYKIFLKKVLLLSLMIVSFAMLGFGATYYISPSGNNGNNGSIGSPWLTLNYACAHATTSGDIIHVNAGTYIETSVSNLAVGVSIEGEGVTSIIKSYVGGTSFTIQLSSASQNTNGNQHISNIKMDGNALTGYGAIRVINRGNVKVYNCTFIDFNEYGVAFTASTEPPTTYVTGNEFHDNTVTNCSAYIGTYPSGDSRGALYIGGQDGLLIYNNTMTQNRAGGLNGNIIDAVPGYLKNVKIYNNTMLKTFATGKTWDFAIEFWNCQGGVEVYNNVINGSIDIAGQNNSKGSSTYSVWVHDNTIGQVTLLPYEHIRGVLIESTSTDVIVEKNYIKNVAHGIYFSQYQSARNVKNIRISYNILENIGVSDEGVNSKGWGIHFTSEINTDHIVDNLQIWNNVIIGSTGLRTNMWGINLPTIGTATNISIRNNIIVGFDYASIYGGYIEGTTVDILSVENNIFYGNGNNNAIRYASGYTPTNNTTQNNLISDPLFVSSSDYNLRSTSPAINKGINIGLTKDMSGNSVVGLPDIGVYEYGTTTTDTEKPIVTGFAIPATSTLQSVSISSFTATDNIGVTGYLLTETSSTPSSGVSGWSSVKPTTYTFSSIGAKSIYAWAKDAAGNVSLSRQATTVISAPVATGFLFTGPSTGSVSSASTNFTVTPNNSFTGTITITLTGTGSAGLSAKVLTFSNSSTAQTFTITPTVAGSITLTPSNSGTLTNPVNLTYTANAVVPGAPTSVIATAGDASASVTFVAPINNGGSAITGYTVTSVPAGGVDTNAGSTLLTHTITGLANGNYTFTVKANNSVGSSVPSAASNSIENIIVKQGEIIPSHFTTVWQGLNGLNQMNINVVSATLEDIPLSADDEIAVFSGSDCVGASKLTQSINPSDNTTLVTILASQNDGSGNGFIDNDTIVFKIWNNKTQTELQINSVVFHNDISTWKTSGRYSPASTAVVEIASYQVYTQSIELLKGYNMISTYVSAQNPNVSAVTKTLVDQGNLIKMQDETGNSLENWGDFGGWINKLGSLEETEGYKIQVANNCTLQVTGRFIAMPFDIALKTGWNIISFPRTDVVNAINVVQSLIDQNKLVKVQDEAGNSIENWGLFGGWKNGIGNFIPGKAYKVKMSADAILTFQESYPKSAVVLAQSEETEYYHSSVEGNGTDHMNINITGLNSIGISVGDELAAFDGAVCVATTKITEANLLSGSACLVSSFSTDNQNQNGFKSGDPIQISAWSKLSDDESKVNVEVITGQMKYEKNASVLVQMKSATIATEITNLNDLVKIDVFPNPCQGQVTVRFSEIPDINSRIEISDLSGRKLISRLISGTSEEFNLDSFTPGLYLVKSILGSNEFVQKLIVNK